MKDNKNENEMEFDIVVIGQDNVALCAAIAAAIKNIKIALLESPLKEWRGGNS